MKTALVLGAGGFIGGHIVRRLKSEGFWVRGADVKAHDFSPSQADEFIIADLTRQSQVSGVFDQPYDEVYQLAADMGGAGYIFTGEHDAEIVHNSSLINLNILEAARSHPPKALFFSSSACVYAEENQMDPNNPICTEESVYPAHPDSEYGWEKLFAERLFLSFGKQYGLNAKVARYHNVFGPEGTWDGGREKAPAALCRKVAEAPAGGNIEIWGDGKQTRSFLFIDECIEATIRLMRSDFDGPVNIGSDRMISINDLASLVMEVADKPLTINNIPGPEGVRGRTSDNRLIAEKLGWAPTADLKAGIRTTYDWIAAQVEARQTAA